MKTNNLKLALILTLAGLSGCGQSDPGVEKLESSESIGAETSIENNSSISYPSQVYWGDTHLHTSDSIDAFGFGNRLDTEAALRFARGEEVTSTRGVQAKLSRPLDFLVISDHSDALGATKALYEAPGFLVRDPLLKRWWNMMHESEDGSLAVTSEIIDGAAKGTLPPALTDPEPQAKRIGKLWRAHNKNRR